MIEKLLLTTEDVATLLDLNAETIRRYIRAGKLKAFKLGKSYRVRREDLERFLEEHEKAS